MTNYKKFKATLKKYEEIRYQELRTEINKVKAFIEKMLTRFFESSTSKAQCNYSGLEMY